MSRHAEEVQFGSDSFLDVVCNIVGILIILIVIAGVRVSRAPLLSLASPALDQPPVSTTDDEPILAELQTEPPEPIAAAVPPPDDMAALQRELSELEREQHELAGQVDRSRTQITTSLEQHERLSQRLAHVRSSLGRSEAELTTAQQAIASTKSELEALRQLAAQLAAQLRAALAEPDKVQRIEHRLTPIGRTTAADELHFRLSNNRVSVVPLESLLQRLKDQIERRKEWLAKARQHEGQVGPVDGYTLRYLVQRDAMSVVDELRYGSGVFRISVARWQLDIDRDAVHETVDQALQPGSRFHRALLEAKSDAMLTFWVYPDSFEAFTRLKAACHEHNFLVAGRPLPDGVPIAGSPMGSRSAGQ